jgi:hypothetical protein
MGKLMALTPHCPTVVIKVFQQCNSTEPEDLPNSQDITEGLQES